MGKAPPRRPLTRGLDALAKAAGRRPGRSRRVVLGRPSAALGKDEILIAVADAGSIALTLVKRAARPPAGASSEEARLDLIARRIAEIDMLAGELAAPIGPVTASPPLSEPEERRLRAGGLDASPLKPSEAHLLHRAAAEYARLLADSYSVEEAAARLGVNGSRIRQRLTGRPPTLYGIKLGRAWRVPKLQFEGRRLVPGLETVLRRLPARLHPVAFHRWLTTPSPDLVAGERPVSPLDWLRTGGAPDAAARLAATL